MKYKLLAIALAFAVNPALSHDEANCASISNLLARLACYDNDHTKVQSRGDQPGVKRQQVKSAPGHAEEGLHQLFPVVLGVHAHAEVDGCDARPALICSITHLHNVTDDS